MNPPGKSILPLHEVALQRTEGRILIAKKLNNIMLLELMPGGKD